MEDHLLSVLETQRLEPVAQSVDGSVVRVPSLQDDSHAKDAGWLGLGDERRRAERKEYEYGVAPVHSSKTTPE